MWLLRFTTSQDCFYKTNFVVITQIRQGSFDTIFIDIRGDFDDNDNEDADGCEIDDRGHDNYDSGQWSYYH